MSASYIKEKMNGRPTIKEIQLPPHVQRALVIRSNGSTLKVAVESVGIDYRIENIKTAENRKKITKIVNS